MNFGHPDHQLGNVAKGLALPMILFESEFWMYGTLITYVTVMAVAVPSCITSWWYKHTSRNKARLHSSTAYLFVKVMNELKGFQEIISLLSKTHEIRSLVNSASKNLDFKGLEQLYGSLNPDQCLPAPNPSSVTRLKVCPSRHLTNLVEFHCGDVDIFTPTSRSSSK
jgi:preprotein translocase subunit Sec63